MKIITKWLRSFVRVISNTIFILKYVIKYAPLLLIVKVTNIFIGTFGTYITVNMARWIFDGIESGKTAKDMVIFVVGLSGVILLLNLFSGNFEARYEPFQYIDIATHIYQDFLSKGKKIDQLHYQDSKFYDIYTRGLNEVNDRTQKVINTVCNFFSCLFQTITITTVVVSINDSFSLFGFAAASLGAAFMYLINKTNYKENMENTARYRERDYIKRITYIPEFTSEIKINGNFLSLLKDRYMLSTEHMKKVIRKYTNIRFVFYMLLNTAYLVLTNMFPWILIIYMLIKKEISMGEATVLINSAVLLPSSYRGFIDNMGEFSINSLYIENLRKIMDFEENIEIETGILIDQNKPTYFSFQHVNFSYAGDDNFVLKDINLDIKEGDKLALVGYNGAGKTTLTKLMLRLFDISQGELYVNGLQIHKYMTKSLRENIAVINQDFKIYSFTIAENVLMRSINDKADRDLVIRSLKAVGMYEKISSWENGIDTFVTGEFDENGQYLSGGESQKIALARIYASKAKYIILDEPTSALDPISENEIINQIFELFRDKTIIMISHRLSTIKLVDYIYFLSNGRISESGTHNALMENKKEYYQFYTAQAKRYQEDNINYDDFLGGK